MHIDIDQKIETDFLLSVQKLKKDPAKIVGSLMKQFLEDLHDYDAGVAGYASYIKSGRKGISLDDLEKDLDLKND